VSAITALNSPGQPLFKCVNSLFYQYLKQVLASLTLLAFLNWCKV
jgi:hypothetical protein